MSDTTNDTTDEAIDTAALRALAEAAPEGPYVVYSDEGPVWLPDGRKRSKAPGANAAGWSMSICYHSEGPDGESHRCIATALLRHEDEPGDVAVAALFAASRTAIPALCDKVDRLAAENQRLAAELAEAVRFRDAHKRAKAENDERFMGERDDARQEAHRLAAENDHLRSAARAALEYIADIANECSPCETPDGGRLAPSDELLRQWGQGARDACKALRSALEPATRRP